MVSAQQRFPAIVGPTASGKSEVALALAARLGGEIVSCDSVQVYRDFQIGCAKPSAAERQRVPHHLLDVARFDEAFDAQRYGELANAALAEITLRQRVAIVCGGTGLYLRTLRWGLAEAPSADPVLRAQLEQDERTTPGCLFQRLLTLDPETAQTIDRQNPVRVLRALEICLLAGEPASALRVLPLSACRCRCGSWIGPQTRCGSALSNARKACWPTGYLTK